ncbi:MAG: hypothetical protein KZQ58_02795 [gamma proteobacterium symbiont of Bathyaustriella thionipta]|nr:hypothetical protein [gamma proteobacterium symbiont of Bathyaustriella thionipta]
MALVEPLKIGVQSGQAGHQALVFEFEADFQALDHQAQVENFQLFLRRLAADLEKLPDDSPEYGWLLLVQQVCEQLSVLLQQEEMDLAEPFSVEVESPQTPDFSIMDFLNQ